MVGNLAKKLDISNSLNLEEAKRHVFFQHNDADGYITLARKVNGTFYQRHYKPKHLAEQLSDYMGEDIYYSQNTFFIPQRRIENIRQLRSLYVDIDCHTMNFKPEWVLGKLELEYFRQSIPEPNLVIFSGRGLVLVWLLEPVTYHALPLWSAVQEYLLKQLKELGSDPKAIDAARVFRIAGTINSKSNTVVRVEYRHSYKYVLRDIQYDYLPELTPRPENEKKKPGRKKNVLYLFNIYSLNQARVLDLAKLVELRGFNVDGYRETICFLYRYWTCCFTADKEDALRQTMEFNQTFSNPLPEIELVRTTKSAEKAYEARSNKEANQIAIQKGYPGAGYNISNAKLIKWLDITEEEMQQLRTIISGKEKRRRDLLKKEQDRREAGIRTKEQRLADDRDAVMAKVEIIRKAMSENPNLSTRALAKKVEIPRTTVQRLIKEYIV